VEHPRHATQAQARWAREGEVMSNTINAPTRRHLLCSCSYGDHQAIFTHWPDDQGMYLTVRMSADATLWKRLRAAVRYLLGRPCPYGDWAEIIIERDDAREIAALLTTFADKEPTP
jgi:hypothetical protein